MLLSPEGHAAGSLVHVCACCPDCYSLDQYIQKNFCLKDVCVFCLFRSEVPIIHCEIKQQKQKMTKKQVLPVSKQEQFSPV